jgi:hypothetical protein
MNNGIRWLYDLVEPIEHLGIHLARRREGPITVLDDIRMSEMVIRD